MTLSPIILSITVPFLLCIGFCLLIMKWDMQLVTKVDRQAHWIHHTTVPRHGGIAFLLSLTAGIYFFNKEHAEFGFWILFSAMPLFLAGTFDDFGHSISPKIRVVACVLASIFALVIFETRITSVEIPGVDWLLTFPVFAIFFTVFASTTLAQAYNLIDGLNGLSSGCGLIALTFITIIAIQHGNHEIYNFSLIALSCLFGFWFLNIMTGWVFLGDGGAYLIGHLVAWTSIIMASTFENVSPWAFLLATAYPVVEILITVVRRIYLKQSLTVPDSDHFHHLVTRLLSRRLNLSNHVNNSLSSFIILTIQVGCMLHALRFKHHTLANFLVFFLFVLTCLTSYFWCSKRCPK